jgi:hypothetical protein
MISPRQYAIAALAVSAAAAVWWLITRSVQVAYMTLAFGLVLPILSRRERERTWQRVVWAFFVGAVVAAGDWLLKRNSAHH